MQPRPHPLAHGTCKPRFLDFLHTAKKTLDVCLFTITCDDIADVVRAMVHLPMKHDLNIQEA